MLKEYFRFKKSISKKTFDERIEREQRNKKTLKERGKDYLNLGGWNFVKDITFHILMSPLYLLSILFSPFILLYVVAALISGIIFYIPVSLIIGGTIDLFRNLFFKKGVRFKKWKYTIQILSWWEFLPYGMTYDGYLDFKEETIRMTKAERIFEDYWDSKIDRKRAEQAFRNIHRLTRYINQYDGDKMIHNRMEEDIRNILDCVDDFKRFHVSKVGVSSSHIHKRAKIEALGTLGMLR
jgi:hypothetical protein|tara:strand:- start:405 stop:1118 length:714 start_codon:yes stop_codon:yes gene_type:complete